jgi:hypothetical protein
MDRSDRMRQYASRVGARMARRLDRVQDAFGAPKDLKIDFDSFFSELDECGHQYGSDWCGCAKCEELRQVLPELIRTAVAEQGQQ